MGPLGNGGSNMSRVRLGHSEARLSGESWRRSVRSRRLFAGWRARIAAAIMLVAALGVLSAQSASADHIYNDYPGRGYYWLANSDSSAILYTTSTSCNPRELEAYDAVKSSTSGEFPNKWPAGLDLRRQPDGACDGSVDSFTDIKLSYEPASNFITSDGSPYGGWNENRIGTSAWCALWSQTKPCGTHIAVVHLNEARFGSSSYSHAYRQRLIMHETGHSQGLDHHCNSDSIMNQGVSSCNGGAWTSVMVYKPTDHQGIRNVYPTWPY